MEVCALQRKRSPLKSATYRTLLRIITHCQSLQPIYGNLAGGEQMLVSESNELMMDAVNNGDLGNSCTVADSQNKIVNSEEDACCSSGSMLTTNDLDLKMNRVPLRKSNEEEESFHRLGHGVSRVEALNCDGKSGKEFVKFSKDEILSHETMTEGICSLTTCKDFDSSTVSSSSNGVNDGNPEANIMTDGLGLSVNRSSKKSELEGLLVDSTDISLSVLNDDGIIEAEEGEISSENGSDVNGTISDIEDNPPTHSNMVSLDTLSSALTLNANSCKRKVVVYGDPFLNTNTLCDEQNKGRGAKRQKKMDDSKQEKKNIIQGENAEITEHCSLNATIPESPNSYTATFIENGLIEKIPDKNKKKRGPMSEERKAKKKLKERMKRAQKNREQGVKRLKLRPVQSKPVTICRHFLNGRCQQGDKCKFSHDTIPLTKSKPCCHFARQSCLKGDNCPFDHQLSKYPCTNFTSQGSCNRGKTCLFSHNVTQKEGILPSNVTASSSQAADEMLTNVGPEKVQFFQKSKICEFKVPAPQIRKDVTFLQYGTSSSENASSPSGSANVSNLPARPPQGINFLSFVSPANFTPFSGYTAESSSAGKTPDSRAKMLEQEASTSNQRLVSSTTAALSSLPSKVGPNPWTLSDCSSSNAGKTPSAVQKALMSTIAFAAKLESKINLNTI